MKPKNILLVIIISILIGIGIFYLLKENNVEGSKKSGLVQSVTKLFPSPSPTPEPTLPPIDQNTNLEMEIKNLKAPDLLENINQLKDGLDK